MHTGHIDVYPTLVDVAINEGLLPACKGNSSLVRPTCHARPPQTPPCHVSHAPVQRFSD